MSSLASTSDASVDKYLFVSALLTPAWAGQALTTHNLKTSFFAYHSTGNFNQVYDPAFIALIFGQLAKIQYLLKCIYSIDDQINSKTHFATGLRNSQESF